MSITFNANLPDIGSAIKVSPTNGLRIQFDVPETDKAAALGLSMLGGKNLVITVEVGE
jgi:hypothetical protein